MVPQRTLRPSTASAILKKMVVVVVVANEHRDRAVQPADISTTDTISHNTCLLTI